MAVTGRGVALFAAAAFVLVLTPVLLAATNEKASSRRVALSCGQTVTTSVTVTADITGCTGLGLVVGASGITVNLNGHSIKGTGSVVTYGVFDSSFTGVAIKNGSISGFLDGVKIAGGSATVQSLRVSGNSETGIDAFASTTITGNKVFSNGGDGIQITCCKATVTGNTVDHNDETGIAVSGSAPGTVVSGNHALNNAGDGIAINAPGQTVTGNIANGNGFSGLNIHTSDLSMPLKAASNTASDNTGAGIVLGPADTDGGGNKAAGNHGTHQCQNVVCS